MSTYTPLSMDPVIQTIPINGVTYHLPATTDDVRFLVDEAHRTHAVLCLRGSAHSRPLISRLEAEPNRIYLLLSKMRAVTFDDARQRVTVQGGCHLGLDPQDPTQTSTRENSLLYQLDRHRTDPAHPLRGWAIPDLGGITHQTVGGFLSTGSSGSSLDYAFNEQLVSLTLVTGEPTGAQVQTFTKPSPDNPDDPFYAVGVGLGQFGVIVSATFQCVDSFNIVGQESVTRVADCPIDLFGEQPQRQSLDSFFRDIPYKRMMWWPQKGVDKIVVWKANPIAVTPDFTPKPYQEVPEVKIIGIETPIPAELAADLMLTGFGTIPFFVRRWLGNSPVADFILSFGRDKLVPLLLNLFVPEDGPDGPQLFRDVWYKGIPMDDRMSDVLIPVFFTELWFPLERGPEVLRTLRDFFAMDPVHAGTFCYEIYGAKASRFWLSPAYETDVFRIDMFWFANNYGSPEDEFYPVLWRLLEPLHFRPHWGKFLPASYSNQGSTYLHDHYPKFEQWLHLREQLDPHQVFVSDYWRGHLGIDPPVQPA